MYVCMYVCIIAVVVVVVVTVLPVLGGSCLVTSPFVAYSFAYISERSSVLEREIGFSVLRVALFCCL